MPLGDRTQMLIEILDSLKDDQICLSCSFEYIRAYVSEQLGCQHKILQVHFVRSTRVFIIIYIYMFPQNLFWLKVAFWVPNQFWNQSSAFSGHLDWFFIGVDTTFKFLISILAAKLFI